MTYSAREAINCRLKGCKAIKGEIRIALEERFARAVIEEGGNQILVKYTQGKDDPCSEWAKLHHMGLQEVRVHAPNNSVRTSLCHARFEIGQP